MPLEMKGIRKVFENCNLLNNERDISTHTGITRIHSLFIFQSFQLHPFTRIEQHKLSKQHVMTLQICHSIFFTTRYENNR